MSRKSRKAGSSAPERRDERSRPARIPAEPPPGDEAVDVAVEDSFPASDPPPWTHSALGAPVRKPADVAPAADPAVPADEAEAREHEERDPERAHTAGREGRPLR